jgi:hypothetical protein
MLVGDKCRRLTDFQPKQIKLPSLGVTKDSVLGRTFALLIPLIVALLFLVGTAREQRASVLALAGCTRLCTIGLTFVMCGFMVVFTEPTHVYFSFMFEFAVLAASE